MPSKAQEIYSSSNLSTKEKLAMADYIRESVIVEPFSDVCGWVFKDKSILLATFIGPNLQPDELLVVETEERQDAINHAYSCLSVANGWDIETLSHNIESNHPEFDEYECDDIATQVLKESGSLN